MVTFGEPYVERMERALVESVVLAELSASGDARTVDDLEETVGRIRGWSEDVDADKVALCLRRLDRDGHVEREGDRYRVTQDGREDVDKMMALICNTATGLADLLEGRSIEAR